MASWRVTRFCLRTVFWSLLLLTLLFIGAIVATRFWLVPNANDFRPRVVESLSRMTGQRVVIGNFNAGWNGWSPELKMERVQMLDSKGRMLLELPEVETTISWRSLWFFEPRLTNLIIRSPQLSVRRTAENTLTVAGIDIDMSQRAGGDTSAVEWLLRQRLVQVVDGEMEWQDDWRKLPPIRLTSVNMQLQNDGLNHRLGLRAVPPTEFASPLDVRAHFVGGQLGNISQWDGSAYLKVAYADLGQIARQVPLPLDIERGQGGLQLWADFDQGRPTSMVADVAVRNAHIRFPELTQRALFGVSDGLPKRLQPMGLQQLDGRVTWREKAISDSRVQQRWSYRDVVVSLADGVQIPANSGEFIAEYQDDALASGSLRLSQVNLGLTTLAVRSIPLPKWLTDTLPTLKPTGFLNDVQVAWQQRLADEMAKSSAPEWHIEGLATMQDVGWAKLGRLPGVSGLNGRVKGTDDAGSIELESPKGMTLDFGELFEAPLHLDRVKANIGWVQGKGTAISPRWTITVPKLETANADATGVRLSGSWRSQPDGPGLVDIKGSIARAQAVAISHYLPMHLIHARAWVKHSVLAGEASDIVLQLRGPLADFPYEHKPTGLFEISAKAHGGVIDYVDQWPRAEAIEGELLFRGNRMEGKAYSATLAGTQVSQATVVIPDLADDHAHVLINGQIRAPLPQYLEVINSSPLRKLLGDYVRGIRGEGDAVLDMSLDVPFVHSENTKVNGELSLGGNRVLLGGDVPPLDDVRGKLRFTEHDFRAEDVQALVLGGPANVTVNVAQGRVQVEAHGNAQLTEVGKQYPWPLLDAMSGETQWRLDLNEALTDKPAATTSVDQWQLVLRALQADWPLDHWFTTADGARDVNVPVELRLQRHRLARSLEQWTLVVPDRLHAAVERSAPSTQGERKVTRAVLDIGKQQSALPARGIQIKGDVVQLNLDALLERWAKWSSSLERDGGTSTQQLEAADRAGVKLEQLRLNLQAKEAVLYENKLHDVALTAQPSATQAQRGQRWQLGLRSREANGLIALQTNPTTGDVDAISLRLQNLRFPKPESEAASAMLPPAAEVAHAVKRWPRLDLIADSFSRGDRELGRLIVRAQPEPGRWRVEQVQLTTRDGVLNAQGLWSMQNGRSRTDMSNVTLSWKDAGDLLTNFGLVEGLDRGAGTLNGTLSWPGSPADFSYAALDGQFVLEMGAGRFTELEPGVAKLLGVLSLQSLPRRLSFRFDDLFGKGFAFDAVNAEVKVVQGVASTEGLTINGPSARVLLRGETDLKHETQHLKVSVYPSLTTATAVGIGLATANPAIGAAALLGQKLARDPIEKLMAQEFEIDGTWSKPDVKQLRGIGANEAGNGVQQ